MTVLVTGAAGVVGSAVVEALAGHDVVRLSRDGSRHSDPDDLSGDVREPRLGLAPPAYRDLCASVDCVVHCAATSNYASREADVRAVNVGGTENVLAFCADADAHLYHVGTVFEPVNATPAESESPFSREPYLRSKRDAEELVRGSGLRTTVLRPSLVIGDADTGAMPRFQGIHTLWRFLLTEAYGVVPAIPEDLADFLPRDTIGAAIAYLVAERAAPELCWLTAGEAATTMQRVVDIAIGYGREIGLEPHQPRFMDPEVIDRLVRPALIPELPHRERQRFEYVIEFSSALHSGRVFPSSLGDFGDGVPQPSRAGVEAALLSSLRYWGAKTGLASQGSGSEARSG